MSNISFIKNAFIYLHFVAWYLENSLRGIRLISYFISENSEFDVRNGHFTCESVL